MGYVSLLTLSFIIQCNVLFISGVAYARYVSAQCANYARDKLNGFEYPIGSRLLVKFADEQRPIDGPSMSSMNMMDTYVFAFSEILGQSHLY